MLPGRRRAISGARGSRRGFTTARPPTDAPTFQASVQSRTPRRPAPEPLASPGGAPQRAPASAAACRLRIATRPLRTMPLPRRSFSRQPLAKRRPNTGRRHVEGLKARSKARRRRCGPFNFKKLPLTARPCVDPFERFTTSGYAVDCPVLTDPNVSLVQVLAVDCPVLAESNDSRLQDLPWTARS